MRAYATACRCYRILRGLLCHLLRCHHRRLRRLHCIRILRESRVKLIGISADSASADFLPSWALTSFDTRRHPLLPPAALSGFGGGWGEGRASCVARLAASKCSILPFDLCLPTTCLSPPSFADDRLQCGTTLFTLKRKVNAKMGPLFARTFVAAQVVGHCRCRHSPVFAKRAFPLQCGA